MYRARQEIAPVSISLLGLSLEKSSQDTVPLNSNRYNFSWLYSLHWKWSLKKDILLWRTATNPLPSNDFSTWSGLWMKTQALSHKDTKICLWSSKDAWAGQAGAGLNCFCSTLKLPYSPHTSCKLHQKSTWPARCINLKQCPIQHLIEIFHLTLKAASNDCF